MGLEKLFVNSLKNNLRLFFGDFSGRRVRFGGQKICENFLGGMRSYGEAKPKVIWGQKICENFSRVEAMLGGHIFLWAS